MHPEPARPIRHAISIVIRAPDGSNRILAVRRPPDDDLPDIWGLPAGRVRSGESPRESVLRAGREKLGVELGCIRRRTAGTTQRTDYDLAMELFEAQLLEGTPSTPQPVPEVTQYTEWRWAHPDILSPAVERGSLCCRLFLATNSACQ